MTFWEPLGFPVVVSLHRHSERMTKMLNLNLIRTMIGACSQHRMLLEVGAHARPYNRCSIGICYEGGLNENGKPANTLMPEQKERITDLLTILHKMFPKARIVGHRDLSGTTPKDCPCFDAQDEFGWIDYSCNQTPRR